MSAAGTGATGFVLVALGGAVGACLRHGANLLLAGSAWPRATLLVNVTGCLAFGLAAGIAQGRMPEAWRLLLVTGLLGGFTTFSAFGGESVALLRQRPAWAGAYIAASVLLGLGAVLAGERLGMALRSMRG